MPVVDEPAAAAPPRPHPASWTQISARGLEMIANFEGFRAGWYDDGTGVQTIGYGHTGPLPPGFTAPLTRPTGLQLLRHDLTGYESAVRALDVHLTTPQGDALCSFAYNCGPGALQGRVRTDLHAGLYGRIPGDLAQWIHAGGRVLPGLVTRRRAEGELFAHGLYPS